MHRLSLVAARGGYSLVGHRTATASVVAEHRLQSVQASVVAACRLQSKSAVVAVQGLAAPQHMGSSRTRNQTSVPYTARQILKHWTTKEAPLLLCTERCLAFVNCPRIGPLPSANPCPQVGSPQGCFGSSVWQESLGSDGWVPGTLGGQGPQLILK